MATWRRGHGDRQEKAEHAIAHITTFSGLDDPAREVSCDGDSDSLGWSPAKLITDRTRLSIGSDDFMWVLETEQNLCTLEGRQLGFPSLEALCG